MEGELGERGKPPPREQRLEALGGGEEVGAQVEQLEGGKGRGGPATTRAVLARAAACAAGLLGVKGTFWLRDRGRVRVRVKVGVRVRVRARASLTFLPSDLSSAWGGAHEVAEVSGGPLAAAALCGGSGSAAARPSRASSWLCARCSSCSCGSAGSPASRCSRFPSRRRMARVARARSAGSAPSVSAFQPSCASCSR